MKKYLKLRSLQITIVSFVILMLVFSTADIYSRDYSWNTYRRVLAFVSGYSFLIFLGWFVFRNLLMRLRPLVSVFTGIILTPVFGIACFLMFGLSMCTFRAPLEGFPEHQEKVRNTRVFIDYTGDQGALGFAGIGVYQDAPFMGMSDFQKTILICENETKYAEITYNVVDEQHIECVYENGKKEKFKLPL